MQLKESTYETIFLLYIDKELSAKERLEVEAFIADNPSYALEMEVLKATVLSAENIQFAFKENLKQQVVETRLEDLGEDWEEDLDKDWHVAYSSILKADMQAIPGLPTSFKNTLKKETVSEGILIKPFGFNQHKFTYAAIAACLMVFIGYQQLTKSQLSDSPVSDSSASNSIAANSNKVLVPKVSTNSTGSGETVVSNANQAANNIEPVATTKQTATINLQTSKSSNRRSSYKFQNESIAIAELISNNGSLNNQAIITKLPSSYSNPITVDAIPLTITSVNLDAAPTIDEKAATSYEVIDTEDPNRTIFIANFEIDGNKFRGLTRRVSALLKRNKSEKEK
jgi:hypothetical protein